MLRASATGLFQACAQRLAGAVTADFEVVRGDPESPGGHGRALAAQLEVADQLAVFGLQRWDQILEAGAQHRVVNLRGRDARVGPVPVREVLPLDATPTIGINDRIL